MNRQISDLIIRDFQDTDISENYLRWLNDKTFMQFSKQSLLNHNFDSAKSHLDAFKNSPNRFFAINRQEKLLGTATAYIDDIYNVCNFGILIGPEFSGRGFGQTVWNFLINDFAKEIGIRKVSAGALEKNLKMIKLFESSGMDFEARLKDEGVLLGQPCDVLLYRYFI